VQVGRPAGRSRYVSTYPGDLRVRSFLQIRTVARELGLDFPGLLVAAGGTLDAMDDPEGRVPIDVLGRLVKCCVEQADCPHFGLLVGRRSDPSSLGELGALLMNCGSVRDALALGTRHLQITDRGAMLFMLDLGGRRTALGYALFAGVIPGAEYILDGALAMQYVVLRELCGPSWQPLRVRLSRARPADLRPYRAALGEHVEFDADLSAIIFDSRWLDRPISGASSEAYLAAARAVESKAASVPVEFSRQVRRAIHALLLSSTVSTAAIAQLFDVAPRTLRRRLAHEGTTVRSLTDDVRRELSFHLLRDTNLRISKVAEALRYADAAVFSRAFRSWAGMSPRQWRARTANVG